MTLVIFAFIVLAAGGAIAAIAAPSRRIGFAVGVAAVAVGGVACLAAAVYALSTNAPAAVTSQWPLPLGSTQLALDGLSAWFLLCVGILGPASAIYSWGYFDGGSTANRAYAPLLCTLVGAIVIVICSTDAVVFLTGWEIMSLSAFFLVGLTDSDAEVRQGAWMYLVATHIGTALGVLPLLGAFVARTGGTDMNAFTGAFSNSDSWVSVVFFILGTAGFGTKAGLAPLHVWLPEAHPVAPSPVSALMSGVVIKTGVYGLLRLVSWFPDLPSGCGAGLIVVSIATGLIGILYALGQRQLKRMLAYSSVENIGIIGIALGTALLGRSLHQPILVTLGTAGALLHVLNHSLFKGLLFLSAGAVLHATGTGDIERLGGLARTMPVNSMMFLTGSIAICALPPLNGFVSEFLIYNGLLGELGVLPMGHALLLALGAAALAIIGGVALVAFSKVVGIVFLGELRDLSVRAHRTPASMNVSMFILALACVIVAVMPQMMTSALSSTLPAVVGDVATSSAILPALGRTASLSLPIGLLLVFTIGLFAVRRWMPVGNVVGGTGRTWGCGYASPAASMQYTGSSYAWKLLDSLNPLSRASRTAPKITEYFPRAAKCTTSAPDWILARMYRPLFKRASQACEALWPLQHGRIQLYLVYIVITALAVFAVEVWQMPADSRSREVRPTDVPQSIATAATSDVGSAR